ncbi:MAG: ABC transporter permease, partial [Proteiniphilum sp.]|nr:ABC transporter permease [Proteiniphilum sp.]
MKTLKFLIEKEFKQMFRNPLIPRMIVMYPIMVLLVFPWAVSFEIKNIRIDVVDHSKSTYSKRLTDKIEASQYFILNDTPPDYQTAMLNMEHGETDMVLEIPASFDVDIVKTRASGVGMAVNSVNGTQGLLGSNYMMQIVNDFSSEL